RPVSALRPETNGAGALPVQPDEVERVRRLGHQPAARRQVPRKKARRSKRGPGGGEEQNDGSTKQLHARRPAARVRRAAAEAQGARSTLNSCEKTPCAGASRLTGGRFRPPG